MKKYLLAIMIIISVIFVSGCIGNDSGSGDGNKTTINTISKNGVIISYPSDWVVSQSSSNKSILAFSKSSSLDSSKVGKITVNIERQKLSKPFSVYVNQTYKTMRSNPAYDLSSSGSMVINGDEAAQYIYTSDINGFKKHKAIWISHGEDAYVLLYSAPVDQFDSNVKIFDFMLNNFKITA